MIDIINREIKITRNITSHPLGWLQSVSQTITSAGENGEELEPLHTAVVNIKQYSYFGKLSAPQKAKHS